MSPFRTGIVFRITVGVFYIAGALAWVNAPGPFLSLMNSLFHGMDFSSMVRTGTFASLGFLTVCGVVQTKDDFALSVNF